ncbi:MAG: hypothetical protein ACKVQC_09890 [Elusimicrobiota bacterium]
MNRHIEEDFETDTIEKCSRALSRLDDKSKIRVIKYLLDKFGLLVHPENPSNGVINQNIQYQQNNLVLAEPKEIEAIPVSPSNSFSKTGQIALKDVLIKGLTKTEPELLTIIGYYNSNFGQATFTRQSILDSYKDNAISTEIRRKNLSQNLTSLIKKSVFNTITEEELSISQEGCDSAINILNGNSTTKRRKLRPKKSRISKNSGEENSLNPEI